MNDEQIYDAVEFEVNLIILEAYEGLNVAPSVRKKIMVFVNRAIRKTIDYKNLQKTSEVELILELSK